MPELYRAFASETAEILGTYDGFGVSIGRVASLMHEVNVHESIHERIFHGTMDGMLHRLINQKAKGPQGNRFQRRSDLLTEETRLPHEICATYLGIQSLNTMEDRARVFGEFPLEYASYYKGMGDVVGRLSNGTYLCFTMGWAIAFWSFQSPRLFEISQRGWDDMDAAMANTPSPSDRFAIAAALLTSRGNEWLDHALKRASHKMAQRNCPVWNLHDDDEWRRRSERLQGQAEFNLSEALCGWLTANAGIRTAHASERPEGFDTWLSREWGDDGVEGEVTIRDFTYHFDAANEKVIAHDRASQAAYASVCNGDVKSPDRMPASTEKLKLKLFRRLNRTLPASYTLGATGPVAGKGWIVYVYTSQDPLVAVPSIAMKSDAFIVSQKCGLELLGIIKSTRFPAETNRPIFIYPVTADTIDDAVAGFGMVLAGCGSGGIGGTGKSAQGIPLWYWTGDWLDLHRLPGVTTTSRRIEFGGTELEEGYSCHFARADGVPGYLVRLHSMIPGSRISDYEGMLHRTGEVLEIGDEEADILITSSAPFFGIVVENWYSF